MEEINLKEFYQYYKKFILGIIVVCLLFVAIALAKPASHASIP